jgi:hypothetical protein
MLTETNSIHVREHGSMLAPIEKRALVWMAQRLPRRINSDHVGGSVAIAGLELKLVVSALRNTCALYLAERLPRTG